MRQLVGALRPAKNVCNTRPMPVNPKSTGSDLVRRELLDSLAIKADHLLALAARLDGDFTVADRGFAQFSAIGDEYDRAVVSDQVATSAASVVTNLLEGRLHQQHVVDRVGSDGIRFPTSETAHDRLVDGIETEMDITGWGRALCSALDCLAGCAIGVLRIPSSLLKAQFSHLGNLPDQMSKGTAAQQQAWQDLLDLVDRHRKNFPTGWFEWVNGMRVLNVHRPRQVNVLLQRTLEPGEPRLAFVADDPAAASEVMKASARFDLHLRQRPQLSDMQDLIEAPHARDIWIAEPAQMTMPGVFLAVNELVEDVAEYLLDQWIAIESQLVAFPPPISSWKPSRAVPVGFAGVTGITSGFTPADGQIHTHPTLAKRLMLAEELATTAGSRRPGAR
jgi:hypothetical protein